MPPNKHIHLIRQAGWLYLGIIVLGISSEVALRGPLIDWSDAAATARAIGAHSGLFTLSIIFDLGMAAFDLALAIAFWRLLRAFGPVQAALATGLRMVQAGIITLNSLLLIAVPGLADPLPALARHAWLYDLGLVFFGLNCLIMAGLLCRSALAPRWIGAGIGAAGLVYLAGSATRFFAPDWLATVQPLYLVPFLAETGLMLWLLLAPARRISPATP